MDLENVIDIIMIVVSIIQICISLYTIYEEKSVHDD